MQVTFLGTGPSLPIPRMYCKCPACRAARWPFARSRRTRSSLLIESRGKHILFDISPDVLEQLEREKRHRIDAVFITHGHADGIGGVYDLVRQLAKLKHRMVLHVERATWKKFAAVSQRVKPYVTVRFIVPGTSVAFARTAITPFRVPHSMTEGFSTLGFKIGKDVAYASDASSIPKHAEPLIRGTKHLILDGCMWFGKKIKSHLTVDASIRIAQRLKVHHLYLTQISHTYPSHTEAAHTIREFCETQKVTIPVTLAYDSYTFTV